MGATTLVDELEQAAREATMMANSARAVGLWDTEGVKQGAFAARLRARAARVRDLRARSYFVSGFDMYRWLAEDDPTATVVETEPADLPEPTIPKEPTR